MVQYLEKRSDVLSRRADDLRLRSVKVFPDLSGLKDSPKRISKAFREVINRKVEVRDELVLKESVRERE